MGKPKGSVVNNIQSLNVEIDYDKLANAIIKAQEEATRKKEEQNAIQQPKGKLFPAIWHILRGKRSKDGRLATAPFAIVISVLYRMIAAIGFIVLVLLWIAGIKAFPVQGWQVIGNIILVISGIVISLAMILYMILFWGAANEMEHETDKNYIIEVFSGMISIASLVVAIIALSRVIG